LEQQLPGNAVPIYLRIVFEQNEEWRKELKETPPRLLGLNAQAFSVDEAGKFVDRFEWTFDQLAAASLRAESNWEYVLEGRDPLQVLLPDAQSMRSFARLIALKARVEIRRGQFPQAVSSLRDGFSLGHHVAGASFLVNQLIGIATSDLMLSEMDDFVQQDGAPNLYWALTELPRPLISLRIGIASESSIVLRRFPELAVPNATHDWQQLAERMRDWANEIARMEIGGSAAAIAPTTAQADPKQLAAARVELPLISDFSADQVAAMSDAEVSVRHTLAIYREISDTLRKWFYVPPSAAVSKFPQFAEELGRKARERELIPLISQLIPALGNVFVAQLRLDRQIARLQAIEALRMHAATTGKLPGTLSEVTIVPVPLDPATGGSFAYQLDGDTATLDVTEHAGMQRDALRMPVKLRLRDQ
jgi:hypothetical protein